VNSGWDDVQLPIIGRHVSSAREPRPDPLLRLASDIFRYRSAFRRRSIARTKSMVQETSRGRPSRNAGANFHLARAATTSMAQPSFDDCSRRKLVVDPCSSISNVTLAEAPSPSIEM
jgi:hypothetical protein